MNKPDFTKKARSIIDKGSKPKNLADFLDDETATSSSEGTAVSTLEENEEDNEIKLQKFVREEFRFSEELSERLRFAAYKLHRKKIHIVQEALGKYLKKLGF